MDQVEECSPSKCEALSSSPSTKQQQLRCQPCYILNFHICIFGGYGPFTILYRSTCLFRRLHSMFLDTVELIPFHSFLLISFLTSLECLFFCMNLNSDLPRSGFHNLGTITFWDTNSFLWLAVGCIVRCLVSLTSTY
jgi:hypothetical protein